MAAHGEQVLRAPRDAVQRAAVLPGRELGVELPRLRAGRSAVSVMTQRSVGRAARCAPR
jgi:hypothetical protein